LELNIKNARIVTSSEDFIGSLLVRNGEIAAIDRGQSNVGEDWDGDVLMPGIVDLHTDNLEKHFYPRPNIDWNPRSAAVIHDSYEIAVGITTIFNSLSIGSFRASPSRRRDRVALLVENLQGASESGLLKADHRIHWRCETTSDYLQEDLPELSQFAATSLFSMMDHTPGQRQYRNVSRHLANWQATGLSEEECSARLDAHRERQARNGRPNRVFVAELAKEKSKPLATHDDECVEHIDEAADLGSTIAEFPVTIEAAQRSRDRGMTIVMGGPNLMRGQSYSGNVRAADLADSGLLDAFASDYVPRSLLESAIAMTREPHGWTLSRAVSLVTSNPARATGLDDRGEIAVGKRADLLRVRIDGEIPLLREARVRGARVG